MLLFFYTFLFFLLMLYVSLYYLFIYSNRADKIATGPAVISPVWFLLHLRVAFEQLHDRYSRSDSHRDRLRWLPSYTGSSSEFSIEHRILHLLDFKKSVFTGVLDEGGEDQVMLEGFLQSVRAMLDANLDDPGNMVPVDVPDEVPYAIPNNRLAAETNAYYPQQDQQNDMPDLLQDRSEDFGQDKDHASLSDRGENFKQGILSGFRKKLKRWINLVSDFLVRKT